MKKYRQNEAKRENVVIYSKSDYGKSAFCQRPKSELLEEQ